MRRDERGQAIVLIALLSSVLILAVGLAMDAGQLYVARRQFENAVSSAAWAAGVVIENGGTAAQATSAASADAALNGYSGASVTVTSPPTTGTYAGDSAYYEVQVTQSVVPHFFGTPTSLSARAVGGVGRSGSGDAIHVLRPTGNNRLNLTGSGSLTVTGSGIQVESTGTAVNIANGSISAPYTRVRGTISGGDSGKIFPAASTGAASVADPFLNLPGPSLTGMTNYGTQEINNQTVTLNPGYYPGGIRIRGSSIVTFNAGIYVLMGGGSDRGLTVSNDAEVRMATPTSGVFIFNTYSNYPSAPGGSPNCGRLDLNTDGAVTLRPQYSGTYAGMVFYQDRNCRAADLARSRNSGLRTITGTVYVPGSEFRIEDAAFSSVGAQFVVYEYTGDESATLSFDPALIMGGRIPAVIE